MLPTTTITRCECELLKTHSSPAVVRTTPFPSLTFPAPPPRASWLILIEFHCMHFVALISAFSGRAIPRMIDLNRIASFSSSIN
jgi:hypothetical protein